jgi:HSP20 family protein
MAGLIPFNRKNSNPLQAADAGFENFYNMLDDFFTEGWPFRRSLARDTFKVDVQENDKEYLVEAELPGVKRDEINLEIDEGKLRISVNKSAEIEEEKKNYVHRERRYSSMVRNIFLANAASEGIKAQLQDGILSVIVPKQEKPDTSTKITIE